MVWEGALQKFLEHLLNTDDSINDEMKFSLMNYLNLIMISSYDIFDSVDQEIKHEDLQQNCNKIVQESLQKLIHR